jgi:ABC-2 type transport system permease protein
MLHAIKAMITMIITASLVYAFTAVVIDNQMINFSIIDWSLLPWLIPFAVAGVYLCTAFMAAIAAAIDDPNHSAKTSIMLLPLLPMILALITMDSPSGWALSFLSYFPLTAFAAMPVKMALVDLPLWQPLLSLSLTLIVCFWIRTAAGNLFKMGMSMYGKEPSLKDMMMWMLSKS